MEQAAVTAPYKRHDLLCLHPSGQQALAAQCPWDLGGHGQCMEHIPAIYKAQTGTCPNGMIEVGISLPFRPKGNRLRFLAQILPQEVQRVISPQQAAASGPSLPWEFGRLAGELLDWAASKRAELGLFGSAALQAVTGLEYLHPDSDLDVIIRTADPDTLKRFYDLLCRAQQDYGRNVDAEVQLAHNRSVKLKELMAGSHSLLVKGGSVPVLARTQDIWAAICSA